MAKKKKTISTIKAPVLQPVDFGPLADTEIVGRKEKWSEFHLKDGTIITIKPIVMEIGKSKKFNERGEPIYVTKTGIMLKAKVPDKLKRKTKKL